MADYRAKVVECYRPRHPEGISDRTWVILDLRSERTPEEVEELREEIVGHEARLEVT